MYLSLTFQKFNFRYQRKNNKQQVAYKFSLFLKSNLNFESILSLNYKQIQMSENQKNYQSLREAHGYTGNGNSRQIEEWRSLCELKDRKILQLEDKLTERDGQIVRLREDLKNKELLIKNYNHNLHSKNVELNKLESTIQREIEAGLNKKSKEIQDLKLIITWQEEEISLLMSDLEKIVHTFEQIETGQRKWLVEKDLLSRFNAQLQKQIAEVQDQNELIITELQETRKQLQLQNIQGEDLISQMEVMAGQIGIAANS